jgi:hypothetical protein
MKALFSTILSAGLLFATVGKAAKATPTPSKPDTPASQRLLVEILKKATTNIQLDLTWRSGKKSCPLSPGDSVTAMVMLGEEITFDFAKADQDPMYAMIMKAAEKGLVIHATLSVNDKCQYKVDGKFYQMDVKTEKFYESNLQISVRMGLTGELLAFRIHSIAATLATKGEGDDQSLELFGSVKADQKMADFQKTALRIHHRKVNESKAVAWYPADIKIIYKNGELIIPIKSSAVPGLSVPPTMPIAKPK